MCYNFSNVLSTMAACSATFVAIIGGLIANKAISNNAEKESIDRQLRQIDSDLNINTTLIDDLDRWMNEYDVDEFIRENIEDFLECRELQDVFDSDNDNGITYDILLPYWNDGIKAVKLFRNAIMLDSKCLRNNKNIPLSILNQLNDFQKKICSKYHRYIKSEPKSLDLAFWIDHSIDKVKFYNEKSKKKHELLECNEKLNAKKMILVELQQSLQIHRDIKGGIGIFISVSILSIILPLIFMSFNPTNSIRWYRIESVISYITFSIGIIIMIIYICSLFSRSKKTKDYDNSVKNRKEV